MKQILDTNRVAAEIVDRLRHEPRMHCTFWDDLMLKENMKDAVREAVGAQRADELFPPSMSTIKIRRPARYTTRTQ